MTLWKRKTNRHSLIHTHSDEQVKCFVRFIGACDRIYVLWRLYAAVATAGFVVGALGDWTQQFIVCMSIGNGAYFWVCD